MMEESESGQKPGESGVRKGNPGKFSWIQTSFDGWDDTKRKRREKTKAEGPGLTKKDKKHQTSNLHISVTAAAAELIF